MKTQALILLLTVFIISLCALGLSACGDAQPPRPAPLPQSDVTVPAQSDAPASPAPKASAAPTAPPAYNPAVPAGVLSAEQDSTPAGAAFPGPDLSAQPRVDDSFFADAAFFGNSLVQGLSLYGGLTRGDFFAEQSAAVYNVSTTLNATRSDGTKATLLDALCEKQYGKLYILLGINELAFDADYYAQIFSALLDEIQAREPQAEFYIMSLTPLTAEKDGDDTVFTQERVLAYNAALRQVAAERKCWFVDLVDALAGPDGFLPGEISTDGIHLTKETYPVWAEYLRTHYAPS